MAADSEGEAWMLASSALFVLGDIGVLSCLTICGSSCVLAEDCTDVEFKYPAGMPAGRAESTLEGEASIATGRGRGEKFECS